MTLKLGDTFPNFKCETTTGSYSIHDYFKGSWGLLFSHPADYTPVCTTELGAAAKYAKDFKEMNVKPIGLSIDSVEDHNGWIKDIQAYNSLSGDFPFPLIADNNREIATSLGMLDPDEVNKAGLPLTARAVFVVGPDMKLKLSILYPATTGRNFDEIIRVIKSLQLTAEHKVATPANWKSGEKCMVVPGLNDDEATKRFGSFDKKTLPSGKGYIRLTADPSTKKQ